MAFKLIVTPYLLLLQMVNAPERLSPGLVVFIGRIVLPEPVRPLVRLHMDDGGAVVGHVFSDQRSCRNRGKFCDLDSLEYLTCFIGLPPFILKIAERMLRKA